MWPLWLEIFRALKVTVFFSGALRRSFHVIVNSGFPSWVSPLSSQREILIANIKICTEKKGMERILVIHNRSVQHYTKCQNSFSWSAFSLTGLFFEKWTWEMCALPAQVWFFVHISVGALRCNGISLCWGHRSSRKRYIGSRWYRWQDDNVFCISSYH